MQYSLRDFLLKCFQKVGAAAQQLLFSCLQVGAAQVAANLLQRSWIAYNRRTPGTMLTKSAPASRLQDPAARPSAREPLQLSWIARIFNARTSNCISLQDPAARPSARELLQHSWITYNRRTLKSSWSRTRGLKARQAGGGPLAGGFCVCCALLSCAAQAV